MCGMVWCGQVIERFSAFGGVANTSAFAVSGTLPQVSLQERQDMIEACPEMRIFFPSLHEPGCFGAELQREACAASICALNPKKHSC